MIEIISKVKSACFGLNTEKRKEIHGDVLDRLRRLFAKDGYKVCLEYPLCFDSITRKSGDRIFRNGSIDLVAVKNRRKIAIEFDNGAHLKFKSIEKLFQVDADLRIGIIRGKSNILGANIERIEQVKEEFGFLKKDFWLIILSENIARKV
ncbi:MAG: hypothetical protein MUO27_08375 [Sedimentisphaerales bacterium]|nr:hypothetical protein [Sedimentisphaerales bacterium]